MKLSYLITVSLVTVAILSGGLLAFAADAPRTEAVPQTASVLMTQTDLQVALIAISNAGIGCDAGNQALCLVVANRPATLAKLQAALNSLQTSQPSSAK